MKSTKKFFAIVTLVMFMMTMIPMAAFGATAVKSVAGYTLKQATAATNTDVVIDVVVTTALTAGAGTIAVTFPAGITMGSGTAANIKVNDTILGGAASVAGQVITITTPVAIDAGKTASISIAAADGFQGFSTTQGADTAISVVTSTDTTSVSGDLEVVGVASYAASKMSSDSTTKSADGSAAVEITTVLADNANGKTPFLPTASLYIWPERSTEVVSDAESIISVKTVDDRTIAAADYVATGPWIEVPANTLLKYGVDTIKVKYASQIAGDVIFRGGLSAASETPATATGAHKVASKRFASAGTRFTQLGVSTIAADVPAGPYLADGTEYQITFTVKDSGGNPLAGEVVQFSTNKSGAMLSKTEATTDVLGQVKVKISANKAGKYIVTAQDGSITGNTGAAGMDFKASGNAFDIVAPSAITDKVAVNTSLNRDFKLYDVYGNQLQKDAITDLLAGASKPTASWITKPDGASVSDSDLEFAAQSDNTLRVKLKKAPDKIGTYTFKVKLANGKSATDTYEVATQGAIVKMTLSFNEDILAWGASSGTATIKYYDANNVYFTAANYNGISFSVDNGNLATYNTNTNKVEASAGANSNYATGTVTITAVDTNRNLVATDTMAIGSRVATLAASDVQGAVGATSTISFQIKDQDGKDSTLDANNSSTVNVNAYVVGKPAGANVTYDLPSEVDYQKSLTRTGKLDLKVSSDKPGDVTYTVVITDGAAINPVTISKTVKASFGTTTAAIGAKSVTMFIGATGFVQDGAPKVTDVAPFIKDSRTFVAVRPIADAFGAEIGWNEATQTVTLTRSDVALTIVIGQAKITKVVGGVTSEVTADVPAFIVDGRTVLPFRAVGEAFGATVNYDATTQAVSFIQN